MKIMLLGDNDVCARAARVLRGAGAEIVALGLHRPSQRRSGPAIQEAADYPLVFLPEEVRRFDARITALAPRLAISVFYGHVLPPSFLLRLPTVNLHPGYLPYNRGAFPNVWAIIDGTPAGVALHEVDAGIDTGPILARRRVNVNAWDTAATLYVRLLDGAIELLRSVAADLVAGRLKPQPQVGPSTGHRKRDVQAIDQLDLDAEMRVGDLLDRLRARTFPPHRGCFFTYEGRRVFVRIEMEPE